MLLIGIAMVLLPGPAILVIPAGLTILGLEFAWARRWLAHIKETVGSIRSRTKIDIRKLRRRKKRKRHN